MATFFCAALRSQAQQHSATAAVPLPAERSENTYAIYSLLTPLLETETLSFDNPSWGDKVPARPKLTNYLIGDTTFVPDHPLLLVKPDEPPVPPLLLLRNPRLTIGVPAEYMERFQGVYADYQQNSKQRYILEERLTLPLPYRLMDEKEILFYVQKGSPRYAHSGIPQQFSPVYFNPQQTLAMVLVNTVEDRAVDENWHVLEKRDGVWQRLSWKTSGFSYDV